MHKYLLYFFCFLSIQYTYSDIFEVYPIYETPPIDTRGDAADDPAFWLNKEFPALSIVFGTDKRAGIYAYNLRGDKITFSPVGQINNIDTRTLNLDYKNNNIKTKKDYSFLVGTNRSLNTVDLWIFIDEEINDSMMSELSNTKNNFQIPVKPNFRVKSESNIYGTCAGVHPKYGFVVFVTEDRGPNVEVYYLDGNRLNLLKTFSNGGESEGCVFDDENSTLFISEENVRGNLKAYKFDKNFDFVGKPFLIDSRRGQIFGDPEGVSIYKTDKNDGYIILSSQGDGKFNIYNRQAPYGFISSFKIIGNGSIDGVSDTDGIETLNYNLKCKDNKNQLDFCDDFPLGVMIVQDGYNYTGENKVNQNFKLVSFEQILDNLNVTR